MASGCSHKESYRQLYCLSDHRGTYTFRKLRVYSVNVSAFRALEPATDCIDSALVRLRVPSSSNKAACSCLSSW